MRELVLVRHGVTAWNVEGRIQGQGGEGLSADGREQAELTARWLAETFPDARLYSSDLGRCRETAAPLAAATGSEVRYRPELRERDFGDWTGHTHAEVEAKWPEQWQKWTRGQDLAADIGGETTAVLGDRVAAFVDEVAQDLPMSATAVLVTHGGPIWHGVHRALDLPMGVLGGVGNASVTVLRVYEHARQLVLWNQVGHLPPRLRSWFRSGHGRRTGDDR